VLTLPPEDAEVADNWRPDVLEKPMDKEDQRRMLLDLNGRVCEVVTGVTIGAYRPPDLFLFLPPRPSSSSSLLRHVAHLICSVPRSCSPRLPDAFD
jgi:hypothetical protein